MATKKDEALMCDIDGLLSEMREYLDDMQYHVQESYPFASQYDESKHMDKATQHFVKLEETVKTIDKLLEAYWVVKINRKDKA